MIINMPYKVFISSLSLCVLFLSACTVLTVNPDPEEEIPISLVGIWDVVNSQDDLERYTFEERGYGAHHFTYSLLLENGIRNYEAYTEFTYRFARDAGIPWRELSWEGISWENEIGTDIIIHHLETIYFWNTVAFAATIAELTGFFTTGTLVFTTIPPIKDIHIFMFID